MFIGDCIEGAFVAFLHSVYLTSGNMSRDIHVGLAVGQYEFGFLLFLPTLFIYLYLKYQVV